MNPQDQTNGAIDAQNLADSTAALVPYAPKSRAPFTMETLIPRNMAFEVNKALGQLIREKGAIDHYVRNELKYISTATLWQAFSGEQVDALGLYLRQFDKGQGLIIADQTGIGKGRQAAGVIRHALMQGYLPVFFTKKPDLFTDMYRDLKAIGMEDIHPFILNTDTHARIKDRNGSVVFRPLSAREQQEALSTLKAYPTESPEAIAWYRSIGKTYPDPEKQPITHIPEINQGLPEAYDMVFCTYSQVQAAHPYKRKWLEALCEAGNTDPKAKKVVLILDESHTAGNHASIIGQWMQQILPKVQSCCYLSATFAKYPEVMPLYSIKTAISDSGLNSDQFVDAMQSGGLALQEVVASHLAASGQLIRRQRSSEGIKVYYETLDAEPTRSLHRSRVDRIIGIMQSITRFEAEYINPVLQGVHASAKALGDQIKQKPKSLGVKQAPYFSRVFTIIDQLLFALKVEAVADKALSLLAQDKKVVVAFKSTMGALLSELNLSSGDRIALEELDFVRALLRGLDGIFSYTYTSIDGEKTRQRVALEALSEKGQKVYRQLKERILKERSELTISPIDALIGRIGGQEKPSHLGGHKGKHYRIAEVTGRSQRLIYDDSDVVVQSFRADTEKAFREFNQGNYDVLLINQSGSTGSSAHASSTFNDQRKRAMLIHQFELDINIEIQKRGRINRTGQVVLPEYYYITSSIPMEQRLMTMLKGKLKSLDANTTGSQKTNDDTLKSADFFNKYGDQVAWEWISDHPELIESLGHPTYHKTTDKNGHSYWQRNDSKQGAIRQLTGRAGLLLVDAQQQLYDELLERYNYQVLLEKQQGTYDLETEFLPLDAEVKKRFIYRQAKGSDSPFGKATLVEQSIVNNLNRPLTLKELQQRIANGLNGEKPDTVQSRLINTIATEYPLLIKKRKTSREKALAKLQKAWAKIDTTTASEKDQVQLLLDKERLEKAIADKQKDLTLYLEGLAAIQKKLLRYIGYWQIGQVAKIPGISLLPSWGVFLGVGIGSAKNPYTLANVRLHFAVADHRKLLSYSLKAGESPFIDAIYGESKEITPSEATEVLPQWNSYIKKASAKREKRFILTENIVGVANIISGKDKLIKYNTKQEEIKTGILLHPDTDTDSLLMTTPISKAHKEIQSLAIGGYFSDAKQQVRFERSAASFFKVFIKKKQLYAAIIDPKLRQLLAPQAGIKSGELAEFVQNGNEMTAIIHQNKLLQFLEGLDGYGVEYLAKAQELEDWEKENEKDWKTRTTTSKERYYYELGKAYGQGSNPQSGFENYIEATIEYPLGQVVYHRPLTDKEKYNYSLIPIYQSPQTPYEFWKSILSEKLIAQSYWEAIAQAKSQPLYQGIETLGFFIHNHPHQDGNSEFVFGRYSPRELGEVAYIDQIGPLTSLDKALSQLQLYVELQKTA